MDQCPRDGCSGAQVYGRGNCNRMQYKTLQPLTLAQALIIGSGWSERLVIQLHPKTFSTFVALHLCFAIHTMTWTR